MTPSPCISAPTDWEGSDLAAAALARLGCRYLAINPGASLRGLHDTLVNPIGPAPEMILTLHEEVAVDIAHGFAKASGEPMAVALHDTVGLLHASMALFNAWVDRTPLVGLVGTGPLDSAQRRAWIDWIHTVNDQTSAVRDWCVWTDQPTSPAALASSLASGWRAARSWPGGPAVLGLDVHLQEAPVADADALLDGVVAQRATRPGPDPTAVDEIAEMLTAAARPLLVADRPLDASTAAALVTLAERVGAGLADMGGGNVPVGHPHDVSDALAEAWDAADLIVTVEARDPAWRGPGISPGGAADRPVVAVGLAAAMARGWMRIESLDARRRELVADPGLALDALVESVDLKARPLPACFDTLSGVRELPDGASTMAPFHPGVVARTLADALGSRPRTVANGWLSGWARRSLRYRPGEFLGRSGGEGLGYGPGASIGAALAHRDSGHVVIDLQGDGDLMYTPEALWTAAHHGLALLVIVEENGSYYRDVVHQHAVAARRGREARRVGPGLEFTGPKIDYAGLARSMGWEAHRADGDEQELAVTLTAAVDAVASGTPVLVSVPIVGAR
ncbi:thiamine pyrophosphate-binding protein [Desertimonas flava]|uniref:thiamine pyrophosphate-binding protein n=1 Tax=Desertimonas flava TaxID=2064846 RepID=UPI000E34E8C0|nr:thiamine pyrophosphate-binding protein [Desertimonas flava]